MGLIDSQEVMRAVVVECQQQQLLKRGRLCVCVCVCVCVVIERHQKMFLFILEDITLDVIRYVV